MQTSTPEFHVINNYKQAWRLLKGAKGPMWVTLSVWIAIFLLVIGLVLITGFFYVPRSEVLEKTIRQFVLSFTIILLTAPLFTGLSMIAVKRARGEPIYYKTGFQYFNQWITLSGAFILIFLICGAFAGLFNWFIDWSILPFLPEKFILSIFSFLIFMVLNSLFFTLIYTFFLFSPLLIADRKLPILKAIKYSISSVKPHWLSIFSLLAIFYGLNFINILLAQIPYVGLICYIIVSIWLLPLAFLNIGVAYHQLIDNKEKTYA